MSDSWQFMRCCCWTVEGVAGRHRAVTAMLRIVIERSLPCCGSSSSVYCHVMHRHRAVTAMLWAIIEQSSPCHASSSSSHRHVVGCHRAVTAMLRVVIEQSSPCCGSSSSSHHHVMHRHRAVTAMLWAIIECALPYHASSSSSHHHVVGYRLLLYHTHHHTVILGRLGTISSRYSLSAGCWDMAVLGNSIDGEPKIFQKLTTVP